MKKTVLIVIRVICIVGFLVCAGVLGWYWHSDRSDRAVAEALAAAHDAASAEAMEQVRAVAADNADTIGWLRIDGTNRSRSTPATASSSLPRPFRATRSRSAASLTSCFRRARRSSMTATRRCTSPVMPARRS